MSMIKIKTGHLIMTVLYLMVFGLTVSASVTDPNIISGITRINSSAAGVPAVVKGGLATGVMPFCDRPTTFFGDVTGMGGLDYVQTAVDDKADADVEYQVTLNKAGTLYLIIDNRVGHTDNITTQPPLLGSGGTGVMPWVLDSGFVQTVYTCNTSTPATVYARTISGAGTINLGAQNDGASRVMYVIAAAPAGWNLAPSVTGVSSTVSLLNTTTLVMNTSIADDGVPAAPGLSILWSTVSAPAGSTVTYTPSTTVEDVTINLSSYGVYTINVTASDGEKTNSKTMVVTASEAYSVTSGTGSGADAYITNDSKGSATSTGGAGSNTQLELRRYDGTRCRLVYLRFDLSTIPANKRTEATLSIYEYGGTTRAQNWGVYGLVNEGADAWPEASISYSTAPGMLTPPLGNNLGYYAFDPYKLIKLGTWMQPSTPATGLRTSIIPALYMDGFIARDTNNLVTFVLIPDVSDTSADWYLSSAEKTADPAPTLTFTPLNKYAKNPQPAWGSTADIGLTQLSWTNPTSGGNITCDVYFRQMTNDPNDDPNYAAPDYGKYYTKIASGISGNSVTLTPGTLQRFKSYRWIVDIHDSSNPGTTARGYLWNFNTNNAAPTVNAGTDQYVWRGKTGDPNTVTVNLTGITSDDGYPNPPAAYTVKWTQVGTTPAVVTISPDTVNNTSVVLSTTGTYTFRLTADDSAVQSTDDVQVYVGATPCAAAQAMPGYTSIPGDLNKDCYVNLQDILLFAPHWLQCSSLVPCN